MKVFLIILAVLIVLFAIILSLSAEATIIYDKGWKTSVQVLFIKKDIELGKLINFILFPDKAGKQAAEEKKKKKENKENKENKETDGQEQKEAKKPVQSTGAQPTDEAKTEQQPEAKKQNFITKLIDEEGIVGILTLVSNLLETVSTAMTTLFRGLHIYSLYVKMIIGGGDAAQIAQDYGKICGIYYPIKGVILNGMKVDQYDDLIEPDFIAPQNEYEFQLIASINVALLLKVGIKAGITFLKNMIKNK